MIIYHIAPKRSGHAFVGNMIRSWTDAIYKDMENRRPERFQRNKRGIIVLQTRDLLNWFASYYRASQTYNRRMVSIWWAISAEVYRPHLFPDAVRLIYDRFFVERAYREDICRQIGGTYNEDVLEVVLPNGDGSSFSKTQCDGRAHDLDVLNRYKQVPPAIYRNLFRQNPGLKRFYCRHTSDPEKLAFIRSL